MSEPVRLIIEHGRTAAFGSSTVMELTHQWDFDTELTLDRVPRRPYHVRFHLLDEAGNLTATDDFAVPLPP